MRLRTVPLSHRQCNTSHKLLRPPKPPVPPSFQLVRTFRVSFYPHTVSFLHTAKDNGDGFLSHHGIVSPPPTAVDETENCPLVPSSMQHFTQTAPPPKTTRTRRAAACCRRFFTYLRNPIKIPPLDYQGWKIIVISRKPYTGRLPPALWCRSGWGQTL